MRSAGCGGVVPDHHGHPFRVEVELSAFTHELQDAFGEVMRVRPLLKPKISVYDITR